VALFALYADFNREASDRSTPAGFIAEPADIAHAVPFLVSDDARYVLGQTLIVDGGPAATIRERWLNIEMPPIQFATTRIGR